MVRILTVRLALACASLLLAEPAARAGPAQTRTPCPRRTPVVEAVRKTRKGVVSLKVLQSSEWGRHTLKGTGVVVDGRGYVVTNHHVVANAVRINATLPDRSVVRARVYKSDPAHDLAILRLPVKGKVQALAFGPASDLMVGETVLAVGNPFGYTNTVSTGIISGLGRSLTMPSGQKLTGLIQTNVALNPGNSGGPLLNVNGEVIGINVAIRDGAQGIAFALNADTVQSALSRLLSAGQMARLVHGLTCREVVVGEGRARQQLVVERVAQGSPAAQAGLKKGDVLRALGARRLANRFDLERALWDRKAGDKVEATVVRAGKESRLTLTLTAGDTSTVTALPRRAEGW
jgi:serine protease Do